MNTTEILVTMNNTMFMQVDGGFVIGSLISPVKYLIDKDVLDKQYEEDSIYGLTIMLEKIVAYVVLFCIAKIKNWIYKTQSV